MKPPSAGIRAPEFSISRWVQSAPLKMSELRGRPVLVDFWDYTCLNCLRTLDYLKAWHERYAPHGLAVVGIHAPEFAFAREPENVERAVRELGIPYPVGLDSDFRTWQAYSNQCWPAKYLFDGDGVLRYYHFGEGDYGAAEEAIQELVRERAPDADLPPVLAPLRPEDAPGAVCLRATPELYLGLERARPGNPEPPVRGEVTRFAAVPAREPHVVYLEGDWRMEAKYAESAARTPARILLTYDAVEVNLVMEPRDGVTAIEVEARQDGEPIVAEARGPDVGPGPSGTTVITVDAPRMYRLVRNPGFERHELALRVDGAGLQAYAFTFTSCLRPVADAPAPT